MNVHLPWIALNGNPVNSEAIRVRAQGDVVRDLGRDFWIRFLAVFFKQQQGVVAPHLARPRVRKTSVSDRCCWHLRALRFLVGRQSAFSVYLVAVKLLVTGNKRAQAFLLRGLESPLKEDRIRLRIVVRRGAVKLCPFRIVYSAAVPVACIPLWKI